MVHINAYNEPNEVHRPFKVVTLGYSTRKMVFAVGLETLKWQAYYFSVTARIEPVCPSQRNAAL